MRPPAANSTTVEAAKIQWGMPVSIIEITRLIARSAMVVARNRSRVDGIAEAATDTVDGQSCAALTGYFGAIDDDQRRARITLLEIPGVSPIIDTAYAAETERFARSVQTLAASSFTASSLPSPQLHVIAQGIIGAITTIATQWLLDTVAAHAHSSSTPPPSWSWPFWTVCRTEPSDTI